MVLRMKHNNRTKRNTFSWNGSSKQDTSSSDTRSVLRMKINRSNNNNNKRHKTKSFWCKGRPMEIFFVLAIGGLVLLDLSLFNIDHTSVVSPAAWRPDDHDRPSSSSSSMGGLLRGGPPPPAADNANSQQQSAVDHPDENNNNNNNIPTRRLESSDPTTTTFASAVAAIAALSATPGQNKFIPQVSTMADLPPHPHAGARDADGRYGLIVDPSPSRFSAHGNNDNQCPTTDFDEGPGGRKVLAKVRQGLKESRQMISSRRRQQQATAASSTSEPVPKILCLVYTHSGSHDRVKAIANTWGRDCDGFIAASNVTDHSIGAINLLHQGPETYDNMWQKIRSIWSYAYDHYRDEYDYFYVCGDDMYVVVDNFRAYFAGSQVHDLNNGHIDAISKVLGKRKTASFRPRPLLFSAPSFAGTYRKIFPLGGCGYALNRAALDLLVEYGLPNFLPDATDPREDVLAGGALSMQDVVVSDFRDEEGAFRCLSMTAKNMFMFEGVKSQSNPPLLRNRYGIEMFTGMKGVSKETTAFHLKPDKDDNNPTPIAEKIEQYHAILNDENGCEPKTVMPKDFVLYGNLTCPFESAKLSQSHMAAAAASQNLLTDPTQETIHGMVRSDAGREFVLKHNVPQIFHTAITNGVFDGRKVLFEGDSLTRQLFMSVACLSWGSGYVESHEIDWKEFTPDQIKDFSSHFPGFIGKGEHSMILKGRVHLKNHGTLVYDDRYPNPGPLMYKLNRPIQRLLDWTARCRNNEPILHDDIPMTSKDVIIINAGLHPDRNTQVDAIKNLIATCTGPNYPQFVYMLTPLQHFNTPKGVYDARMLDNHEMKCRASVSDRQRQYGDISNFGPIVPLLGEKMDQQVLGDLKVWRGDCTHWIMPGMHDVLSAELVSMLQNKGSSSSSTTTSRTQ